MLSSSTLPPSAKQLSLVNCMDGVGVLMFVSVGASLGVGEPLCCAEQAAIAEERKKKKRIRNGGIKQRSDYSPLFFSLSASKTLFFPDVGLIVVTRLLPESQLVFSKE